MSTKLDFINKSTDASRRDWLRSIVVEHPNVDEKVKALLPLTRYLPAPSEVPNPQRMACPSCYYEPFRQMKLDQMDLPWEPPPSTIIDFECFNFTYFEATEDEPGLLIYIRIGRCPRCGQFFWNATWKDLPFKSKERF